MSIKFAVLGLLIEGPMHGYAVHATFEETVGDFWELNFGQVYQVLTALEREGLVVASAERVGKRPWRRVYAASAKGRDAFCAWLAGGVARTRPFRDDFFLRLFFAARSSPERIGRLVDAQLEQSWRQLSALILQRTPVAPGGGPEVAVVRRLFVEAAILHAEAQVKSLELCRKALAGLRAGAPLEPLLEEGVAEGLADGLARHKGTRRA